MKIPAKLGQRGGYLSFQSIGRAYMNTPNTSPTSGRITDEQGKPVPGRWSAIDWAREVKTGGGTSAKALLLAMCLRINDAMYCWPSWRLLGNDIEASRMTVFRALAALEVVEFVFPIATYNGFGQSSNLYVVNVDGWLDDLDSDKARILNRIEHIRNQYDADVAPKGRRIQLPDEDTGVSD